MSSSVRFALLFLLGVVLLQQATAYRYYRPSYWGHERDLTGLGWPYYYYYPVDYQNTTPCTCPQQNYSMNIAIKVPPPQIWLIKLPAEKAETTAASVESEEAETTENTGVVGNGSVVTAFLDSLKAVISKIRNHLTQMHTVVCTPALKWCENNPESRLLLLKPGGLCKFVKLICADDATPAEAAEESDEEEEKPKKKPTVPPYYW